MRSETLARWPLLALALALPPLATAAEPLVLSLESATERALGADPELRALAGEADAARVTREAAGALFAEDPTLDAAAGPRWQDGESSVDLSVALSQPIEIAGQRGARRGAADARVAATRARQAERRVAVIAEVREAFGRALGAAERVSLEERAVALAGEALAATEERVRAGDAARIDENAARVERARARREAEAARRDHRSALAALRVLVGAGPDDALSLDGTLEALAGRSDAGGEIASATAVERRPDVIAAREELRAAQAERTLADREALPDVRLGASYAREEQADIVQGLLSVDLPLFQRNRPARAEARARQARAEAALTAASRRGAASIAAALSRRDAARALVAESGGETLAAAEENPVLVQEAYAAGKAGFLELLLVRRDALDTRRAHLEALVELNAAEAQLASALASAE